MKITFWGATDNVTGSKTFVELPEGLVLIDCGLVQGPENSEEQNLAPLPFKPKEIKAVIITHAHLDHTGYLPRLVKRGFEGTIYCTSATSKLMRVILLDSAKLSEEEFYSEQDVMVTLSQVKTIEWNQKTDLLGAQFEFIPAGHILGASSVCLKSESKRIIFSGDLGRFDDPLLFSPEICPETNLIVMESTYGGKCRQGDYRKELHSFIATVAQESRVGIIASFAVARAQMLMSLIYDFFHHHPEYKVRVVLDSPMMKEASKIYKQYSSLTHEKNLIISAMEEFDVLEHEREWESLQKKSGPLIIISSSGMLTGGRIKRHLANWQSDEKAILFLPGYQGEGTPGRAFLEGERTIPLNEEESIHWRGEVWSSEAFSSHADQSELIRWLGNANRSTPIYLIHGEAAAKTLFRDKLMEMKFDQVYIPKKAESLDV
jgi:metallo-beta-lactamase family protein